MNESNVILKALLKKTSWKIKFILIFLRTTDPTNQLCMNFYFLLVSIIISGYSPTAKAFERIEVFDEFELIRALGSERTIYLNSGRYDLSFNDSLLSFSPYYSKDTVSGMGMVFHDLKNVKFIGKGKVELITTNYDDWVLNFRDCEGISFENMTVGHDTPTDCEGGTASFENSSDIEFKNVGLYGCGTTGLVLDRVSNFRFKKSEIYKCTFNLVFIRDSRNIKFKKSIFRDSEKLHMFIFDNTENVLFKKCEFKHNRQTRKVVWQDLDIAFLKVEKATSPIDFVKCKFRNNSFDEFCNNMLPVRIKSCSFIDNGFAPVEEKREFQSTEDEY